MRSCEELYGMPYKEAYAEVRRLEALIEEKDMWAMNTIIKHYQKMWT
jgi:Mn-dependent DtxR family transcriptional regulator